MHNNNFIMKKVILTLSLCLGILCFSCENKDNSNNKSTNKTTDNEVVRTTPVKKEVTRHPDTIIDGVRIYNFGKENVKQKEITLEEAINLFDQGVSNARTCEELIKACSTFDTNIKRLNQKDSSINVTEVEKRNDVKAIRKISEDKSLKLCQVQQIR